MTGVVRGRGGLRVIPEEFILWPRLNAKLTEIFSEPEKAGRESPADAELADSMAGK